MDTLRDLELLIRSRYLIIAIETFEVRRAEQVLQRIAAKLDIPFYLWTLADGLRQAGAGNPVPETKTAVRALSSVKEFKGEGIFFLKDLHRFLGEPEVAGRLLDVAWSFSGSRSTLILVAPHINLPEEVRELAAPFKLELPSTDDLAALTKEVLSKLSHQHRVKVELSGDDFDRLVDGLKGFTLFEAERAVSRSILDDLTLNRKDLDQIVEIKKELLEKDAVLEYVPADDGMAEVGGLTHLKTWLEKRRKAYTAEARRFGITPPKGILLLGVQGCGKSLAAKAVAREWGLPLLKLEPGRLYDMYIGESEKNLERALTMAERMAPCVLMVDEMEKALVYAGGGHADAGLSRRILGRILNWMQDRKAPVFVVATCNDVSQLPPELMRKGRFDEIFFIDLPGGEDRKAIFAVHLKKRKRDPSGFDLDALAAASEGFSGAEIEQAIVAALYTAFAEGKELTTQHILNELRATRPLSVVRQETVAELRQWARDRTVMAG
ncbi:MAG: AAA family ATPase [bacterium]